MKWLYRTNKSIYMHTDVWIISHFVVCGQKHCAIFFFENSTFIRNEDKILRGHNALRLLLIVITKTRHIYRPNDVLNSTLNILSQGDDSVQQDTQCSIKMSRSLPVHANATKGVSRLRPRLYYNQRRHNPPSPNMYIYIYIYIYIRQNSHDNHSIYNQPRYAGNYELFHYDGTRLGLHWSGDTFLSDLTYQVI